MIPMSIATPFSKHPQLRSPKGLPRRFEGTSASLEPSRTRDVRVSGRTRRLGRTAEPVTRRSGQGHNGDGANEGQTQQWKRLHLLGKTKEHLPYTACARRYPSSAPATHEFAAKAAAVYFAKHRRESSTRLGGRQVLLSKKCGAPTANFARELIPLQLKPHR